MFVIDFFYRLKQSSSQRNSQLPSMLVSLTVPGLPSSFSSELSFIFFFFFLSFRCCGPKIIGCYVPSGEHCERPLEVRMNGTCATTPHTNARCRVYSCRVECFF